MSVNSRQTVYAMADQAKLHRGLHRVVHTNYAFRYHWAVWHLTGIQAPSWFSHPLYAFYACFINLFVTLLFPLTLVANLFHTHNLQQLCENLTITVTDSIANLKFLNVWLVRAKLLLIKDILERLDGRVQGVAERDVLHDAVRTAQNSFCIFWCIYMVGTGLSLLRVSLASKRMLLYPAWFYAVNWQHSDAAFAAVFVYQLFALIVQATQNCANDSYPPAYLCVLSGHMKALNIRIRRIVCSTAGSEIMAYNLEQNYRELVKCICDYLNILKLHSTIQHIISGACLAQFVCSALVQCTVTLHFLYVVDTQDISAQILSIVFFISVTLEVFIVCYFGHCMREQSELLTEAFFSCGDWTVQLPKFKRALIITLMRTQRPCKILAGNYIPVDLPVFLLLMKYTYSAFTLLMRFK